MPRRRPFNPPRSILPAIKHTTTQSNLNYISTWHFSLYAPNSRRFPIALALDPHTGAFLVCSYQQPPVKYWKLVGIVDLRLVQAYITDNQTRVRVLGWTEAEGREGLRVWWDLQFVEAGELQRFLDVMDRNVDMVLKSTLQDESEMIQMFRQVPEKATVLSRNPLITLEPYHPPTKRDYKPQCARLGSPAVEEVPWVPKTGNWFDGFTKTEKNRAMARELKSPQTSAMPAKAPAAEPMLFAEEDNLRMTPKVSVRHIIQRDTSLDFSNKENERNLISIFSVESGSSKQQQPSEMDMRVHLPLPLNYNAPTHTPQKKNPELQLSTQAPVQIVQKIPGLAARSQQDYHTIYPTIQDATQVTTDTNKTNAVQKGRKWDLGRDVQDPDCPPKRTQFTSKAPFIVSGTQPESDSSIRSNLVVASESMTSQPEQQSNTLSQVLEGIGNLTNVITEARTAIEALAVDVQELKDQKGRK